MRAKLFLIFSVLSVAACAQKMQDVVFMKDGSILKGSITDQIADSVVILQVEGIGLLTIQNSSIVRIEREEILSFENSGAHVGYTNLTSMNFMGGYDGDGGISFSTVHGYRFRERTMLGGGIALAFTSWTFIDLFAEVRHDILNRKATPYLFASAGIGIPLAYGGHYEGQLGLYPGGMWSAGLGMRFFFPRSGSFTLAGGFRQNFFGEDHVDYSANLYHTDHSLNYLAVSFGLAF